MYHESTIQSADSIESHPSIGNLFALGTYQVDQQIEQNSTTAAADRDADEIENDKEGETLGNSPEYSRKGTLRLKRVNKLSDGKISRWVGSKSIPHRSESHILPIDLSCLVIH